MPVDRRVDVHPVGDDLDGDPVVLQQRDDRAGLAAVDGPHRVEQMGTDSCAGVDGRAGLGVGRLGVPDGHHDTRRPELGDGGERAVAFRSQRHHPDAARPGIEHTGHLVAVRIAHQRGFVCTTAQLRKPRTFQVDTVEQSGPHIAGQRADLAQ